MKGKGLICMVSLPNLEHNPLSFALGRHMTIEYYDCDRSILNNATLLEEVFRNAAKLSGATVIDSSFHAYQPQGVSGFVVIAESHFSVHTWPEHDYAAVDIFTCGTTINLQKAIDVIREALRSDNPVISADMGRGIISNNGLQRTVPIQAGNKHDMVLSWREMFEAHQAWGILTSVDIYGCDPNIMRNASVIQAFVDKVCEIIEIKRLSKSVVFNFSEDERVAGFSTTQRIGKSLISGHFASASNTWYLDILNCKYYEPRVVAEYALEFFKGTNYRMQVTLRQ